MFFLHRNIQSLEFIALAFGFLSDVCGLVSCAGDKHKPPKKFMLTFKPIIRENKTEFLKT
jgi:hypothetical protein